jgi:hypothetical protein
MPITAKERAREIQQGIDLERTDLIERNSRLERQQKRITYLRYSSSNLYKLSDQELRRVTNNARVFFEPSREYFSSLGLNDEEVRVLMHDTDRVCHDPVYQKLLNMSVKLSLGEEYSPLAGLRNVQRNGLVVYKIIHGILLGMEKRLMREDEYTYLKEENERTIYQDLGKAANAFYETMLADVRNPDSDCLTPPLYWKRKEFTVSQEELRVLKDGNRRTRAEGTESL